MQVDPGFRLSAKFRPVGLNPDATFNADNPPFIAGRVLIFDVDCDFKLRFDPDSISQKRLSVWADSLFVGVF